MPATNSRTGTIRSALFVDFDNIFSCLSDINNDYNDYAESMASGQKGWLPYLENNLPSTLSNDLPGAVSPLKNPSGNHLSRRILIRRCYMNPDKYRRYRPFFTTCGFEVIDCPVVTRQGKTSTDIHLVMDVMDVLNHPVYYDEIIIFSGDADFAPLLRRVRMHDRMSSILAVGNVSKVYIASTDYVIPFDEFLRDAIGIDLDTEGDEEKIDPDQVDNDTLEILQKIADKIHEAAEDPDGVQSSDLPSLYDTIDGYASNGNWMGFNSLQRLTEAVVAQRSDLIIVDGDPLRVARTGMQEDTSAQAQGVECGVEGDFEKTVKDCIIAIVSGSERPVKMAPLAWTIRKKFEYEVRSSNWAGAGSFKNLLQKLNLDGLKIAIGEIEGYIYDPEKHDIPAVNPPPKNEFMEKYPRIAPLAQKIHQLTNVPYLMPEHYRVIFEEIAREINDNGYDYILTTKAVRDRCAEVGVAVTKSQVSFVLQECNPKGEWYISGKETVEKRAPLMAQRIIELCTMVQLDLSKDDEGIVKDWIVGAPVIGGQ